VATLPGRALRLMTVNGLFNQLMKVHELCDLRPAPGQSARAVAMLPGRALRLMTVNGLCDPPDAGMER